MVNKCFGMVKGSTTVCQEGVVAWRSVRSKSAVSDCGAGVAGGGVGDSMGRAGVSIVGSSGGAGGGVGGGWSGGVGGAGVGGEGEGEGVVGVPPCFGLVFLFTIVEEIDC